MAKEYVEGPYYNKEHAYVPTIRPESCPPFGVTRHFSLEEIKSSADLRNSIDLGYLIPYDPDQHATKDQRPKKKTAQWVEAADSLGGEVIKHKTKGKTVEYITATEHGVDGVENASPEEVIASVPGQKPVDYIEKATIAPPVEPTDKPYPKDQKWENASDAFEAELKRETTEEMQLDDEENLAEMDPEREEAPDADDEIAKDYAQTLKPGGNQGATLVSVKDAVEEDMAKAVQAIDEQTRAADSKASDDGEAVEHSPVCSRKTVDFLKQNFAQKKWLVSKETDTEWLGEVKRVTHSGNLRSLVDQRIEELASDV